MATKRNNILTEFDTRMIAINGAGNFVHNLSSNVFRVAEIPVTENENFVNFPAMYYLWAEIETDYEIGNRLMETMVVDSYTFFDSKLSGAGIDDFISDVYLALATNSDDITMNGLADFFLVNNSEAQWLEEENLTSIHVQFNCQYRRSATER